MPTRARDRVNMKKVSSYAIAANGVQIAFAVAIFLYALLAPNFALSHSAEKLLVGIMSTVVIWGAALDIREAFSARKVLRENRMIEDALSQLERLNGVLRAQRHDFMNHLQVVYSLTEMEEYSGAMEYIERVYGDIQRVSKTLKTSIPAVNALLAAKVADCEEKQVSVTLDISSDWDGLPMHGWEMCRILGNLIDNAVDAVSSNMGEKHLSICITGDVHAFTFKVSNNGPAISLALRESIFEMGFSTKTSGRGMGLYIVKSIMKRYNGTITLAEGDETCFIGTLPKPIASEALPEGI